MTYNIRYLAIPIVSLKVCNVRYIFHANSKMLLYNRNAVKYSFFYYCLSIEGPFMFF